MSINTKTGRPNAAIREGVATRLAEMQARADAATDGPWWTEFWLDDLSWREGHYSVLAKKDDPVQIVDPSWETSEEQTKADGTFIANARTDLPATTKALADVLAYVDECERVGVSMHPADVRRLIAAALGVTA